MYHESLTHYSRGVITTMVNVSMATSLLIGHLRSDGISLKTPSHPEPASHNQSSSISQCSWKGGEGSPGCCSREEGQHRIVIFVESFEFPGNDKCLQRFYMCVGLVSPQRREEQHRHEQIYSLAVWEAPPQIR